MYINVAMLKETRPHERRVALVPSVAVRLIKLGARLHMQSGAGDAVKLADSAYKDVAIIDDMTSLFGDADVVLAVQPPGPEIIYAMKPGATLSYFIYENNEPTLVQRSRERHQSGMSRNGSSR
jgi:NAD(P) transhydrogenase subunit alpha